MATVVTVLSLLGTAAVAGGAATHSGVQGTKASPAVEDCGLGAPESKPKSLTIACGDANTLATKLTWTSWGSKQAVAKGVYTWNTCEPNCAASKTWDQTSATYTLKDPVDTKSGWLFESLSIKVTGSHVKGMPDYTSLSEKPLT